MDAFKSVEIKFHVVM